ncbi:MAG: hypothetical protein GY781_05235 [Gammaproteobacteria bacterium]|nr:hypothetical protein [Gammaproteobacteria bacterium]
MSITTMKFLRLVSKAIIIIGMLITISLLSGCEGCIKYESEEDINQCFRFSGNLMNPGTPIVPPSSTDSRAVATNEFGDAMSIWPVGGDIYAQRYRANSGWEEPILINQTGVPLTEHIDFAMNGSRAEVVWQQSEGDGRTRKVGSLSYNSNGWSDTPVIMDHGLLSASPVISAFRDSSELTMRSNKFWKKFIIDDSGFNGSWVPYSGFTTDNATAVGGLPETTGWHAFGLDIAVGKLGTVTIWSRNNQDDHGNDIQSVFIKHLWDDVIQIDFGSEILSSKITFIDDRTVMAAWIRDGKVFYSLGLLEGTIWSNPKLVSYGTDDKVKEIAINGNGDGKAIIVWIRESGQVEAVFPEERPDPYSYPYIINDQTGNLASVHAGLDSNGNARIVWRHGKNGMYSYYDAATDNWTQPAAFTTTISTVLDFAMDYEGFAVAVWNDDKYLWRTHTLTLNTIGEGSVITEDQQIDCGETCTTTYSEVKSVTLTANPDDVTSSHFVNWTGSAVCTENATANPITITVDHDINCTAIFAPEEPEQYDLIIVVDGTGSGKVTSDDNLIDCTAVCTSSYTENASVILSAIPDIGSTFSGWSDAKEFITPCVDNIDANDVTKTTISVTSDIECTATFTQADPITLVVQTFDGQNTGSGGTVESLDGVINCIPICSQDYAYGTEVELTATQETNYYFVGWDGDPQCTEYADGNKTRLKMQNFANATLSNEVFCEASFLLLPTFDLSIVIDGTGSGTVTSTVTSDPPNINCTSDCINNFAVNDEVTLKATPDAGSIFVGWSGHADCANAPITITTHLQCTATFDSDGFTYLYLNATGTGTGSISTDGFECFSPGQMEGCNQPYNENDLVQIQASPSAGSIFAGWSAGCPAGQNANYTLTIPATNVTCIATFNLDTVTQYNLSIVLSRSGTGTGTVTSLPGIAGINCPTDCSEDYDENLSVTLTATADAGSRFVSWSGPADCTDGVVTMTANIECTATFVSQYDLDITVNGTGSGTVSSNQVGIACPTDCSETYDENTGITLTATADAGSVFVGWSGPADCTDGVVTMTADIECTATFDLLPSGFTITLINNGDGTGMITSSPAGFTNCLFEGTTTPPSGCNVASIADGTNLRLIATPSAGFGFEGWDTTGGGGICDRLIDIGTGVDACEVDVTSDMTIVMLFVSL